MLLVDDLVSEAIVAFAQPSARVVHVGKRGGCKSTPQTFIEKLMLTAALEGENVVRLKGGDPFVFGRGGEEAEHLRAAGVEVRIVNGISAGLAAPSSLGVPLTHREHARGVVFVTGHAAPKDAGRRRVVRRDRLAGARHRGARRAVDAGDLHGRAQRGADPGRAARRVVGRHAGGRDPARELPAQRHVVCALGDLCGAIAREDLGSPAIIVVGDVLRGLVAAEAHTEQPGSRAEPRSAR